MKLYAPKYYEKFKCIADKCIHNCCIGWEIDVDENSYRKYKKSKCEYAETVLGSIENIDTPHFILKENDRCPHLNDKNLCEIIINMGEEYICDICREHPRFYNFTNYGKEVGIGMSCPEACRIILNSDDYDEFEVIARGTGDIERIDYDSIIDREKIYSILKENGVSLNNKIDKICTEYEIDFTKIKKDRYLNCINNLEYLNNSSRELFSQFSLETTVDNNCEKHLERALAYFVYRHCTESTDTEDFKISLSFCLFCEKLLMSLTKDKKAGDVYEFARIISEEIEYSQENTDTVKEFLKNEIL